MTVDLATKSAQCQWHTPNFDRQPSPPRCATSVEDGATAPQTPQLTEAEAGRLGALSSIEDPRRPGLPILSLLSYEINRASGSSIAGIYTVILQHAPVRDLPVPGVLLSS